MLELLMAAAIVSRQPALPQEKADLYAKVIVEESTERQLDPWVFFAIIDIESRWKATAINYEKRGGCSVGLGGIYTSKCTDKQVARLMDPVTNLRRSAAIQQQSMQWCETRKCPHGWVFLYNRSKRYVQRVHRYAKEFQHEYAPSSSPQQSFVRGVRGYLYSRKRVPWQGYLHGGRLCRVQGRGHHAGRVR